MRLASQGGAGACWKVVSGARITWRSRRFPTSRSPDDLNPSARYWERNVVTPEWTMKDGMVSVPLDGSGIGVAVNTDRVDNLTVRRQALGAPKSTLT